TGSDSTSVGGPPFNTRAAIFLFGNETAGQVRISRPMRSPIVSGSYSSGDPTFISDFADTFVATATGNFDPLFNVVPDVFHLSLNGNIWVDSNRTSVLNHAPILTIKRSDLNAPFPGGGRKEIITAGQSASIPVTGTDPEAIFAGQKLTFRLVAPPTGE